MKDLLAKERNIIKRLGEVADRKDMAQTQLDIAIREMDELVKEAISTTRISITRIARVCRVSRQTLYKRVVWREEEDD